VTATCSSAIRLRDDFSGFVFDHRATWVAVEFLDFFESDDHAAEFLSDQDGFVLGDVLAGDGPILS